MKNILSLTLGLLATCVLFGQNHWSHTWKQFNHHTPALDYVGTLATPPADGSGHSLWSVGCETLDRDYAVFANYKEYLSELGVGYARIQSGWAKTEQKKGKYDYKWLDPVVDGIIEEGLKPWMTLCYGNPIYGDGKGLGSKIFTDEVSVEAWKKYVEATVKRYKGKVVAYEIWNEPNLASGVNTPHMYADLVIMTGEVIRRVDPQAKIITFALAGTVYDRVVKYVDEAMAHIAKAGKLDLIDYVSFHGYYTNPDESRYLISEMMKAVRSYIPDVKFIQGEAGCPAHLEWTHALKYLEWSEYSQAKWDARRMACDYSMGTLSSIFTFVDLKYVNMQQSFGLMRANLLGEVIYKRPAWHAVQNMAAILTADTFIDETISASVETGKSYLSVGLKDKDGKPRGVMVYFNGNPPTDTMVRDLCNVTVNGIAFKDPVYVEPITGKVLQLVKNRGCEMPGYTKFYDLPLWDSPIFIMEKDAVVLQNDAINHQAVGGSVKESMF